MFHNKRGSLTIEAAIVMPVMLIVIFTMGFLIQIFYVHMVVQHAINETAKEMATYTHLLEKANLYTYDHGFAFNTFQQEDDTGWETVDIGVLNFPRNPNFRSVPGILDFMEELNKFITTIMTMDSSDLADIALSLLGDYILSSAMSQLPDYTSDLDGQYIANLFGESIAQGLIRKYFVAAGSATMEERLDNLNIEGGLDFEGTEFFASPHTDRIRLVVTYKLRPVLPVPFFDELIITQHVIVRAWAN